MKKLRVSGFRSLKEIEIPAEGLVFICGGHGAGKSSLAGAVGTALTGRNRWTDKAGKGAERQISHGSAECVIELDVADRTVTRTIHARGNNFGISGVSGSATVQAKAFLAELGSTRDALEIACDTSVILNATPKERADIIFSALAPKISEEDLKSLLPPGSECDAVFTEFIETGASFPLTAVGVEKLYKFLYDARHAAKKGIEQLERELSALSCEAVDAAAAAATHQKLSALEKVRAELTGRLSQAEAYQQTRMALESLVEEVTPVEELKRRLEEFKADVVLSENNAASARGKARKLALQLPPVSHAPEKSNSSWAAVIEIADDLDRTFSRLSDDSQLIHRLVAAVNNQMDRLRNLARKNGAVSMAEAESAHASSLRAREVAVAALQNAERAAADAERKVILLREKYQKLESALFNAQKREAFIFDLSKRAPEDVEPLKAKLSQADSKLASLRLIIAQSDAAERNASARIDVEKRLSARRERTALLEMMVSSLQPANRTMLLEKKTGPVCRRLQAAFASLTGNRYSLEITFDPFEIRVQKSGAVGSVALASLSDSEKYRTAVLLQDAVASLGRSPFLVVDGTDILLPAELKDLLEYLKSRRSRYQAVIVTAADDGMRAVDPAWQALTLNAPKPIRAPARHCSQPTLEAWP